MKDRFETQTQEQSGFQTSNEAYIQPNVLQMRLDTNELLDRIKIYLSGKRISYVRDENTGEVKVQDIMEGEAIANSLGVQSITSWLGMQLNPATVQGNLEDDRYDNLLERTRKRLAKHLLVNSPKWGIRRHDRPFIVDGIINMEEMFISRTRKNKERESYSPYSGFMRVGNLTQPAPKHFK